VGYQQLAIILEKDGILEEAVALCQQALDGGWNGDWEKRIARCRERIREASTRRQGA
jgi:hypothetical protein